MKKRLFTMLITVTMIITTMPIVFADEVSTVTNVENDTISTSNNEITIYDNMSSALEANSKTVGILEPTLIRSGNTTKVELYLAYTGSLANMVRFKSIVVESVTLGINYKVFKPTSGTYKNIGFTAGTTAYIKIGNLDIPTNKERAIVRSNDLYVYTLEEGWQSYSNINGIRKIK